MPDYTSHQKKIIERYYDNRDDIMLQKLSELVSELFLADSERARDRLWQRVALALKNLKVKETLAAHILAKRDIALLAGHLKEWLGQRKK